MGFFDKIEVLKRKLIEIGYQKLSSETLAYEANSVFTKDNYAIELLVDVGFESCCVILHKLQEGKMPHVLNRKNSISMSAYTELLCIQPKEKYPINEWLVYLIENFPEYLEPIDLGIFEKLKRKRDKGSN